MGLKNEGQVKYHYQEWQDEQNKNNFFFQWDQVCMLSVLIVSVNV